MPQRLKLVIGLALLSGACRSVNEFNPYASLASYEVAVIEDFEGPGTSGYDFAERLARAVTRKALFGEVLREPGGGRAIRISGTVLRYKQGNAALKIKYGPTMGNARFRVRLDLEDVETGDFIGSLVVSEEFKAKGPLSLRNQNVDELAERAAETAVSVLLEESALEGLEVGE